MTGRRGLEGWGPRPARDAARAVRGFRRAERSVAARWADIALAAGVALAALLPAAADARDLSLDEALAIAVRGDRARVVDGDLQVAERRWAAQRIGFLVPEISVNAILPAYSEDQSFREYRGLTYKTTIQTTDFNMRSNIQLRQHLITGGEFTARANLFRNKSEYPNPDTLSLFIDQTTRQGSYEFELTQPLLAPSEAKNTLANLRDDLAIAELTRRKETSSLKVEVAESYFGLLKSETQLRTTTDRLEAARLQAEIDSLKLADGIISEEDWLESASSRLEAELALFEARNTHSERMRELTALLDFGGDESLHVSAPAPPPAIPEDTRRALLRRWDESTDVEVAELEYGKEKRATKYESSGRGLTGELTGSYSLGRGTVATSGEEDDKIKTNSWQLSVNLTYPIWDGGASKASLQAARIREERSRLEYENAQRTARTEIVDTFNRLEVSGKKLDLLRKQVELAGDRLEIARQRRDNGEISDIELLERRVERSEAEEGYLEELRSYTTTRLGLEARWEREALL